MRSFSLSALTCATLLLSGCATLEQASSSLSCMLARATGSADASCGEGDSGDGTLQSAQGDRFDKLQLVLDQEVQRARQAQDTAVTAMQKLPANQRAVAGPVRMLNVTITDSQSGRTRTMQTLDSVTVDMPLAAKGRPEYTQAMDQLKALANQLADNRGTASIIVDQSEADIKARRVNTATGTTQSPRGNSVAVRKNASRDLAAGVERYTIQAGEIRGKL